ncbi:MAG: hypothetical protein PHY93_17320 [Bacteriovorax sp.]|nr:hypothetical protein [Bacteriovorax sp.]
MKLLDGDSRDINESDSHSVFGLGYVYQFNIRPEMELNLNEAVLFIGEQEIKNTHDTTVDRIDSATAVAVGPELIFYINPKMIVTLSYAFASTEDFTKALEAIRAGKDIESEVWLCPTCGHLEFKKPSGKMSCLRITRWKVPKNFLT